jgi:hypothetical protein
MGPGENHGDLVGSHEGPARSRGGLAKNHEDPGGSSDALDKRLWDLVVIQSPLCVIVKDTLAVMHTLSW